jgi:hypothetical protein
MVADRVIMSCCSMVLPAVVRHDRWMTIIKINAIRVPRESGDELAHRFAARAGAVDDADGFQGYELLKPTDDRDQWLVIAPFAVLLLRPCRFPVRFGGSDENRTRRLRPLGARRATELLHPASASEPPWFSSQSNPNQQSAQSMSGMSSRARR